MRRDDSYSMSALLNAAAYLSAGGRFKAECPTFTCVAGGATEFGMSGRRFFYSGAETRGSKARGYAGVREGGSSAAGNLFVRATDGMR